MDGGGVMFYWERELRNAPDVSVSPCWRYWDGAAHF